MQGRLVIEGELSLLSAAAAKIAAEWPDGLKAQVEVAAWNGYTPEVCKLVYNEANGNAKKVLSMVVAGGGFVPDSAVREELQSESLRGKVTGSITRGMRRLQKAGAIPDGLPKPLKPGYNDKPVWQKTSGFSMPEPLVPLFAAALGI